LETEIPLLGLVSDFKRQAWEVDTYNVAKVKEHEESIKKLISMYQPVKDPSHLLARSSLHRLKALLIPNPPLPKGWTVTTVQISSYNVSAKVII